MVPPATNVVAVASRIEPVTGSAVKRIAWLGSELGEDDAVMILLAVCSMLAVMVGVGALLVVTSGPVACEVVVGGEFCVDAGGKVLAVGRIRGRVEH